MFDSAAVEIKPNSNETFANETEITQQHQPAQPSAAAGRHSVRFVDEPSLEFQNQLTYHPRQNTAVVIFVYVCFVINQIFLNYDSGAIPSVLGEIQKQFDLSTTLLGVLGALPYLGLLVVAPFIGILLEKFQPKRVIIITLIGNVLAVGMLGASLHVIVLYISRFLLGVSLNAFSFILLVLLILY